MVRNTRLMLACGLLTAVTAALLGSRPLPRPDATGLLPLPFAAGYAVLRSEGWLDAPAAPAPPMPVAAAEPAPPSLEGHRRPRGPRTGRDELTRSGR